MLSYTSPKTITSKTVSVVLIVRLNGRRVGVIKQLGQHKFRFERSKSLIGEIFSTIEAVKKSLE